MKKENVLAALREVTDDVRQVAPDVILATFPQAELWATAPGRDPEDYEDFQVIRGSVSARHRSLTTAIRHARQCHASCPFRGGFNVAVEVSYDCGSPAVGVEFRGRFFYSRHPELVSLAFAFTESPSEAAASVLLDWAEEYGSPADWSGVRR